MISNCSFSGISSPNVLHNLTIAPRLDYSTELLSEIIEILKKKRSEIKKSNQFILDEFEDDKICQRALEVEQTIAFSLEILSQIQKRTVMISNISNIPEILPLAIPMIRQISAQLHVLLPQCSQKLSELSVHLGSIVLDSATLTEANFDFSSFNEESTILLDEVKLMVDSKISKQYPNLDFFKA